MSDKTKSKNGFFKKNRKYFVGLLVILVFLVLIYSSKNSLMINASENVGVLARYGGGVLLIAAAIKIFRKQGSAAFTNFFKRAFSFFRFGRKLRR